jgi:predicted PurR-regulated permease PerM
VRMVQRFRLPRVVAVLIVAVLAFAAIFALARTLVSEVERQLEVAAVDAAVRGSCRTR